MKLMLLYLVFGSDVDNLGSSDYQVREQAHARLLCFSDLVWPLLDRPFKDHEVRRRARQIVNHAVPSSYPPIAVLTGNVMPEWVSPELNQWTIGSRPTPEWRLAWTMPNPRSPLLPLVRYYHETSRTQYSWKDWHCDNDGRKATRLLVKDLLVVGIPAPVIRKLVSYMEEKERRLEGQPNTN